ncbi:MAG: hypothetical protein QM628_17590 [Propionicimonas sp.]
MRFYDQCREAAEEVRQGHWFGWISDEHLDELRAIVRAAGEDGLGS